MKRIVRSTMQTAVNLVFFAAIGTAVLSSTFFMTHEKIVKSEAEKDYTEEQEARHEWRNLQRYRCVADMGAR